MTRQDLTLEKQAHVTRKAPRYIARPDMPDTVEVQHIGVAKGFKYKMQRAYEGNPVNSPASARYRCSQLRMRLETTRGWQLPTVSQGK